MVVLSILFNYIDWGPQRYEHWNGSLYDVRVSRPLNIHWGQQIASFGLFHLIRGQQHAIGCLFGVWVMKIENTEAKIFFCTQTLYFDEKSFGPKNLFSIELPFLSLAHLLKPNGQLFCKFEHHQISTAKLRSVFVEFYRKTLKNPFFRRFLAQNIIFFLLDLPLLISAHLLHPTGQLSCEFERRRMNTQKLPSVFLEF